MDWAIDGFHLMYADSARIELSIRSLQDLDVASWSTHYTGGVAFAAFRRAYGAQFVFGGVGREVVFDSYAASSPAAPARGWERIVKTPTAKLSTERPIYRRDPWWKRYPLLSQELRA